MRKEQTITQPDLLEQLRKDVNSSNLMEEGGEDETSNEAEVSGNGDAFSVTQNLKLGGKRASAGKTAKALT